MSKKAFDQIMEGLNEALAVVRGEVQPFATYKLGRDQYDAFVKALDNPPSPDEKLLALMRKKPIWAE